MRVTQISPDLSEDERKSAMETAYIMLARIFQDDLQEKENQKKQNIA